MCRPTAMCRELVVCVFTSVPLRSRTVDISPSARFCITEAEIVTALYNGIVQVPTPPHHHHHTRSCNSTAPHACRDPSACVRWQVMKAEKDAA